MNEKRKGKYGYVEFVDKRKLRYDGYDDNIEPEFRKPTPAEREEIILNFICTHSGKSIRVWWLAEKLGVSDRTIQKILKKFEEEGLISRMPLFTDTGKQRGNILTYLGAQTPIKKTDLTLKRDYALPITLVVFVIGTGKIINLFLVTMMKILLSKTPKIFVV